MIEIEEELKKGNVIQIQPQGYSMYPLIRPKKDFVKIEQTEIKNTKRGDVLLYRRESGILVLHRVYRKKKGEFFMVGDNQTEIEGPLKETQIKGKMTAIIRNGTCISVRNPFYQFVTRVWLFLRPVRPLFWKISGMFRAFVKMYGKHE